jgi:hypothetical protein
MSVPGIMGILGPARRDVGSGVYTLIWEAIDGTRLRVSSPGSCGDFISMGIEK